MIHSFPFYIADWRDSSARIEFSTSEKLLYLELIIWCWKDGDLPTAEDALRTISGMPDREFRAAWKKVQGQFYLQDDRYHHHKVDAKREELEGFREKHVRGAQRTNEIRAQRKAQRNAQRNDERTLKATPSSSSSAHNPYIPLDADLGDGPEDLARDLYLMWPEWPEGRRGTLKTVMDEIVVILSTSGPNAERDLARIRENAENYIAAIDDPAFCKGLPNWLSKGLWQKSTKTLHPPRITMTAAEAAADLYRIPEPLPNAKH